MINNPSYFDPFTDGAKDRILPRYNYVLEGMYKEQAITSEQYLKAKSKLPKFRKQKVSHRFGGTRGYLLEVVKQQMREVGFLDSEIDGGGLKIVTTFSRKQQAKAVSAVKEVRPSGLNELHTAVVSVQPGTGAVRALYGGSNYLKSQLNWATLKLSPARPSKRSRWWRPWKTATACRPGSTATHRFGSTVT